MPYSTRTIGIVIASVLAVGCMLIAVVISGPLPFHFNRANAESTHDLLVSYAAKDTDGDGLPDWEEALYGTDPNNPHSVSQTLTDGDAVAQGLVKPKFATATSTPVDVGSIPGPSAGPETVTDQFARTLFAQYLSQRGPNPPTNDDIRKFIIDGVAQLEANQKDTPAFTRTQVHASGSGADALRLYASAVGAAFDRHPPPANNDVFADLYNATIQDDPKALAHISATANDTAAVAHELMQLPVPSEAAASHLALANSLMQMSATLADMAAVKTDPIRAMVGIDAYDSNDRAVLASLASLNAVFKAEGVTFAATDPGASFYAATTEAVTALANAPAS